MASYAERAHQKQRAGDPPQMVAAGWHRPGSSPLPLNLGSRPQSSWMPPINASGRTRAPPRPATATALPREQRLFSGGSAADQVSMSHLQASALRAAPPSPKSRGFRGARYAARGPRPDTSRPSSRDPSAWAALAGFEAPPSPPKPQDGPMGNARVSEPVRLEAPTHWGAPPWKASAKKGQQMPAFGSVGMVPGRGAGNRTGNSLQDYSMLASACFRAGRRRDEAVACYASGVLLDNAGKTQRAAVCYHRMLDAAEAAEDVNTQVIAHNSLGVSHHKLRDYQHALDHHNKHLELADSGGKFSAYLNMGLALSELGQYVEAQNHFREALRQAIRTGSLASESLACGNLAIVGKRSGDLETASSCLERYLRLAASLKDDVGQADAHQQLGGLALELGALQDAGSHFEEALSISGGQPERQFEHNGTKVELGMAQGQFEFESFLQDAVDATYTSSFEVFSPRTP